MKKHIFLVILLLGSIPYCFSQQEIDDVRFGVRAGINFSHLNFSIASNPPANPIKTAWYEGAVGGFYMIVPLHKTLYIQPEYLFSMTGGNTESNSLRYKLNYLSLPIFLRWEVSNRVALIAGPQFDLLINAEQTTTEQLKITAQTESRSVGLAGGLEFGITRSFGVGMRYFQSVNDIWIPVTNNNRKEFKHQLLQATVYYLF